MCDILTLVSLRSLVAWPLSYSIEVATETNTSSKGRRHKLGPVNERSIKVMERGGGVIASI